MKYFAPLEEFSSVDIEQIRKSAGMTRNELAAYLGVSPKAVETWEYGKRTPSGPVCRLLSLLLSISPETVREGKAPLPFELLPPEVLHYAHGRTFVDPSYHVTVTWKDEGDLLYLDFRYLGRTYHVPARMRFFEREEDYELLCREGSQAIDDYIKKQEFEKWHRGGNL